MSIVLLFEALVKPGRREAYLDYSLEAQRELASADGCLSSEQLLSVGEDRKILVKSVWRDRDSLTRWHESRGLLLEQKAVMLSLFERASYSILTCLTESMPSHSAAPSAPDASAGFAAASAFA